jgi:hypothetical protein
MSGSTFPPIAELAFLADTETNALVAPGGTIEWLCVPRPDSPMVRSFSPWVRIERIWRIGMGQASVSHGTIGDELHVCQLWELEARTRLDNGRHLPRQCTQTTYTASRSALVPTDTNTGCE